MRTISQRELRNESGAILRAVEAGQSMVVTKSGIPVAELRPVNRRTFVPAGEWARIVRALPAVDHVELRADIDSGVDQTSRDPFDVR